MRAIRTYWACPDEAAIAACFPAHADPVAAMEAARAIATQAIDDVKTVAKQAARDAGCSVLSITDGEPVRNPRDWSDARIWYPVRLLLQGTNAPYPQPTPFPANPLLPNCYSMDSRDPVDLFDRAQDLLGAGNFELGWPLYEYRWQMPQGVAARRPFTMPLWDGKIIPGLKLLAHTAQGYGDSIMFARYLPWLNDVECDLLCFDTLTPLLQTLNFRGRVMAHQDIRTEYDAHIPLCSLPLALDPQMRELPRAPYLRSDREKYFTWRDRLGSGYHVGVCWAGSESHLKNADRSMTLETVLKHCPPGATLHSLQMGEPAKQLAMLPEHVKVSDFTADLHDWSDTAAFVDCLDLIVTVDTAVAHLAGALNRPVRLLVKDPVEWRWAPDVERGRSRWYSSVEIVRVGA